MDRFGQVRAALNLGKFGQVHTEPGPNLPEPAPAKPNCGQVQELEGLGKFGASDRESATRGSMHIANLVYRRNGHLYIQSFSNAMATVTMVVMATDMPMRWQPVPRRGVSLYR